MTIPHWSEMTPQQWAFTALVVFDVAATVVLVIYQGITAYKSR